MTEVLPPLIRAMLRPGFYPHPTKAVHMRQTHASWVLLTGEFAYKVKKPVDFGFLDFSSLEKRRHLCHEELRLNRRLAPELYLDVLPIVSHGRGFRLGGNGDICEWCLKMRQFDEDDLLAERIVHGGFDPSWMDTLARDIAGFHARTEQDENIRGFGDSRYLQQHIDASLDTAARHPEAIDPLLLDRLRKISKELIETHADTFEQRMAGGAIRDCHGDLHLGNIALYGDRPTVFDCIEFNPEYRAIDTMNDTAFLVMDCLARGHPDLAFRFLSRYLEHSGDYGGTRLLPLFLSYRAGVRGKVACLLAEDTTLAETQKRHKLAEASDYFRLAADFLQPRPTPALYAIGGLSGSGKSHLALEGCGMARAVIIRSDATRKRIARDHPDPGLYGEEMNRKTYQAMYDAASQLLASGWSVILDATFLSADERQRARELARTAGALFHFIWLDVPEKKLRAHIRHRQSKGKDISDADLAVLEQQLANYHRPDEADIRLLSSAETWPWTQLET